MKSVKIIILLICFVGLSTPTQAQFWKKITKKIQKKAEDKVLDKVDKTTDKKMDDVLEGSKKTKKRTPSTSVKKSEKLPQNYTFNTSLTVEIITDQEEKATFQYFFNNSYKDRVCFKVDPTKMGANTGGSTGEMYMVMDKNSSTLFMNMMGMKIKKTMSQNQTSQFDNSQNINDADIVKTGKTKAILGFQCNEYIVTQKDDKEMVTHIWAATNFPIKSTFIPILGMKNNNTKIKGFVLEMEVKTTKGNTMIKVTNINYNAQLTIRTDDYKSMGF